MDGQFAEPAAEVHQILGADVLIAEDDQLVLDQGVLDHRERLLRERTAQIDAADLGAEMDADPPNRKARTSGHDRPAPPVVEPLVHAIIPSCDGAPSRTHH